jgi:hypothetical protein
VPVALRRMAEGDTAADYTTFEKVGAFGVRFGDRDLTALSMMGRGQSLIQLGEITEGLTVLDEAMVAVTTGEVSPTVTGRVYCAVIDTCLEVFDVGRAQGWTDALTRWCERQTGPVQFAGVCLLHRSELRQLNGDWAGAIAEVERACQRRPEATPPSDLPITSRLSCTASAASSNWPRPPTRGRVDSVESRSRARIDVVGARRRRCRSGGDPAR